MKIKIAGQLDSNDYKKKVRNKIMTLEEAIERYEKLSKEYEKEAKVWHEMQVRKCELIRFAEMDYTHENECKKYAEEYRQLAEWLIELKKYQEKDRYNNYDVCLGGFHLD